MQTIPYLPGFIAILRPLAQTQDGEAFIVVDQGTHHLNVIGVNGGLASLIRHVPLVGHGAYEVLGYIENDRVVADTLVSIKSALDTPQLQLTETGRTELQTAYRVLFSLLEAKVASRQRATENEQQCQAANQPTFTEQPFTEQPFVTSVPNGPEAGQKVKLSIIVAHDDPEIRRLIAERVRRVLTEVGVVE